MTSLVLSFPVFEHQMDSLTMAVPWSTWLSRINVFATEVVPSLELPLKVFRTRSPLVVVVGLGVVVWWRSRRDGGEIRRCVEVTVEMVRCHCRPLPDLPTDATTQPTPYTLLYVLGYLTAALLVLDVWNLASLFPFAVLGTCNLRFSRPKSTDVGCEPVIPEPSLGATSGKLSPIPLTPGTVSQLWIRVVPYHHPSKQSPLKEVVSHSRR